MIHEKRQGQQPLFRKQDVFFSFIAKQIKKEIPYLAINFAYPLTPVLTNNFSDGVLLSGTKENQFQGLVGKIIGKELSRFLQKEIQTDFIVSVANDTICLLLSSANIYPRKSTACCIVGTGVNNAFFKDDTTVVNLESANFSHFPQSEAGKYIDQMSQKRGSALFEKEISGAYLYQHYNFFNPTSPLHTTEQLSLLAKSTTPNGELARSCLHTSAQLAATSIAGILNYKKQNLTFLMDGSLFWRGYEYKETVMRTVSSLTAYKATFVNNKDSAILGAGYLFFNG